MPTLSTVQFPALPCGMFAHIFCSLLSGYTFHGKSIVNPLYFKSSCWWPIFTAYNWSNLTMYTEFSTRQLVITEKNLIWYMVHLRPNHSCEFHEFAGGNFFTHLSWEGKTHLHFVLIRINEANDWKSFFLKRMIITQLQLQRVTKLFHVHLVK